MPFLMWAANPDCSSISHVCAGQQFVEVVGAFASATVGDFLALDAERGPRHCPQSFGADVLLAIQAHAEAILLDSRRGVKEPEESVKQPPCRTPHGPGERLGLDERQQEWCISKPAQAGNHRLCSLPYRLGSSIGRRRRDSRQRQAYYKASSWRGFSPHLAAVIEHSQAGES
jgi:hypothetical protein